MRIVSVSLLILSGTLFFVMPAHAARSYDACTSFITALPAHANTPGTYCLKQDLTYPITTGAAITIDASNVTIDCNDFKLDGLAAGAGTRTAGILTTTSSDITVRHCNVRGFYRGIDISTPTTQTGVGGNLVEDNHLDSNTIVGIRVAGDNSTIRRNDVLDTGGSTVTPSNSSGITTSGMVDVYDNIVAGVITSAGSGEIAKGIYIGATSFASVYNNHISGVSSSSTGSSYGINLFTVTQAAVRDNTVAGNNGAGGHGILCSTTGDRLRNNVFTGLADSSLDGCGDAGGNDFGP